MTFEQWWALYDLDGYPPKYVAELAWKEAIEQAAQAVEKHDVSGREWVAGSFWDVLSREASGRIRALGKEKT